jgi:hypothetical protein
MVPVLTAVVSQLGFYTFVAFFEYLSSHLTFAGLLFTYFVELREPIGGIITIRASQKKTT